MYILYNVNNDKKSNIKGFWKDSNNKLYIDNIHLEYISNKKMLASAIKALFDKGEQAVFYINQSIKNSCDKPNIANIVSNNGSKTKLSNCIILEFSKNIDIDNKIIDILLEHEGLTLFEKANKYIIKIWSK